MTEGKDSGVSGMPSRPTFYLAVVLLLGAAQMRHVAQFYETSSTGYTPEMAL